jgi:hypothetical protein
MNQWKRHLQGGANDLFAQGKKTKAKEEESSRRAKSPTAESSMDNCDVSSKHSDEVKKGAMPAIRLGSDHVFLEGT